MSPHEFLFALELSDATRFAPMLSDVAKTVLGTVGAGADALAALTTELHQALSAGAERGARRCSLRFQVQPGALHILVACAGQPEWRTTFALPNP